MHKKYKNKLFDYLRPKIFKFLSFIFFGIAIFYIGLQIFENWQNLGEGFPEIKINYFIFYLIFLQIYFLYQANIWKLVLKSLNTKINFNKSLYMYFSNNLLAYTPGKIANALGMASVAKKFKISIPNVITTLILFQIYSLISGTLLISLFSFFGNVQTINNLKLENMWILFIASLTGMILIHPSIQQYTIDFIKKISNKSILNPNNNFRVSLSHILRYAIGWLIYCLSFTFLIKSLIINSDVMIYPTIVVIFIGSYLSGLLTFVVPAGFGIVEAGLMYGFSSLFQIKEIIFVIIIFRLGNIFSNLLSWILLRIIFLIKNY